MPQLQNVKTSGKQKKEGVLKEKLSSSYSSWQKLYDEATGILGRELTQEGLRRLATIRKQIAAMPPPAQRQRLALPYVAYPGVTDADFQSKIARKKEFAQHALSPVQLQSKDAAGIEHMWSQTCSRSEFRLTPTQLFLADYFAPSTPYSSLLLFHGVGVGKTCSAVSIAEGFVNRRALVIVNPALQDNFRKEIFDVSLLRRASDGSIDFDRIGKQQCVASAYLSRIEDKNLLSVDAIDRRISKLISQKYTFMGPRQFANYVGRLGQGDAAIERIRQRFSSMLIIVDEAHHLRNSSASAPVAKPEQQETPKNANSNSNNKKNKMDKQNLNQSANNKKDEKMVVPALRKVLQYADDVKLLLMSATPMFNDTRDILELVNLMLLNDRRQRLRASDVFDASGKMTKSGRDVLLSATRGYISYMRGENPFSFPLRLRPTINKDPLALVRRADMPCTDIRGEALKQGETLSLLGPLAICGSPMSTYQASVYTAYDDLLREAWEAGIGRQDKSPSGPKTTKRKKSEEDEEDDEEEEDALDEEEALDALVETDVPPNDQQTTHTTQTKAQSSRRTMLLTGLQICNIVFPSRVPGAPRYGIDAMMNCMDKTQSKPLRMRYRPGTPPFLDPGQASMLQTHAPKMHAIVQRVLNSEGPVFVYSRFNWLGLIPLAMALEHAGLQRFNGRNILEEDQSSGGRLNPTPAGRKAQAQQWRYTMLCGTPELTHDATGDVAAARAPENIDGSVVKVILASEFATEGIDLKYIREVHVLDPWYHLNKVEQIFGRASRFCSHADLPLAKRNVTLYMHASVPPAKNANKTLNRHEGRETVDLRAYRIAATKNDRILQVERTLISNAVDCHLNAPRLFYDPRKLPHIDIMTSQGTVAKNFTLGDHADHGDLRFSPVTCTTQRPASSAALDASTFVHERHAHGVDDIVNLLVQRYSDREEALAATFRELFAHVKARYTMPSPTATDEDLEELLMLALDHMLSKKLAFARSVGTAREEEGFLVYRSDKYLFQPSAAPTAALTLEEREGYSQAFAAKHVLLRLQPGQGSTAASSGRASSTTLRRGRASSSSSASQGQERVTAGRRRAVASVQRSRDVVRWDTTKPLDVLERRVMQLVMRMPVDVERLLSTYADELLDWVLDRLKTSELLDVCTLAAARAPAGGKKDAAKRLAARLAESGLVFQGGQQHLYCYDPITRSFFCLDAGAGKKESEGWSTCAALELQHAVGAFRKQHARLEGTDIKQYAGFVMCSGLSITSLSGSNHVFKIVGSSKGSAGCVCYQTSSVTVSDMVARIKRLDAKVLDIDKQAEKRALCELYEVLLRKHSPHKLLRPVQYNVVKGAYLSSTTRSSS
jgi:hypothetical protein